ncbi:MAG: hypothetical protein LBQ59_04330 [Candidatus Peribacteria bacterium]|jgi:hypothetical protein|nr:hypothetical protein [Candidatus Peribacteria bacterium]
MKKILISFTLLLSTLAIASADDYLQDSIEYFKNAPSFADLEKIEDEHLRYCEEIFLMAYMRREFTEEENNECRELFARRIEAEYNYKKYVLENREVY